MSKPPSIELTDPIALRAVAHPLRLELIGLLRREGSLTATQAAAVVGESPANCSFHLRQLAKYGLVEDAGGGRGRERPWRATAPTTEWPARGPSAESDEAGTLLSRIVVERYFERALEWLEKQRGESPEWAEAAILGEAVLYLTSAELEDLKRQIDAVLEPYLVRLEDPSRRPQGARAVSLIRLAFPIAEAEHGGE